MSSLLRELRDLQQGFLSRKPTEYVEPEPPTPEEIWERCALELKDRASGGCSTLRFVLKRHIEEESEWVKWLALRDHVVEKCKESDLKATTSSVRAWPESIYQDYIGGPELVTPVLDCEVLIEWIGR